MTNYEKFLKGDIIPKKWQIFSYQGGEFLNCYSYQVSRYNNIYYILFFVYERNKNFKHVDEINIFFNLLEYKFAGIRYYYYENKSPYPALAGKLIKRSVMKKYKEKSLNKFLKNPVFYLLNRSWELL